MNVFRPPRRRYFEIRKPEEHKIWMVCKKAQDAAMKVHDADFEALALLPRDQQEAAKAASYAKLDAANAAASAAYDEAVRQKKKEKK